MEQKKTQKTTVEFLGNALHANSNMAKKLLISPKILISRNIKDQLFLNSVRFFVNIKRNEHPRKPQEFHATN